MISCNFNDFTRKELEMFLASIHDGPKGKRHLNEFMKTPIKQEFECSMCNVKLSSFINLEVHTMIFHEHKCPECYEQSASKAELLQHIKAAHDEKKHCCPHCDMKFSLEYTLETLKR